MSTELSVAYCAGLFDGEGCVAVYLFPKQFSVSLSLNNTDFRLPLAMYEVFEGRVSTNTGRDKKRAQAVWTVRTKRAVSVARALLPYSISKHDQLELLLQLEPYVDVYYKALSPNDLQICKSLTERIAELKRVDWESHASRAGIDSLILGLAEV